MLPNCSTGDKSSIGDNTEIVVSNSVTTIPANAFDNSLITSIELPRTISSLETFAFFNCKNLLSITIPSSVTDIKEHAFNSCGKLAKVTFFPDSKLRNIGYGGFASCNNLVSITIPSGVSIIGAEAFTNCFKLIEVYNLSPLVFAVGSTSYGNVSFYAKDIYSSLNQTSKIKNYNDFMIYENGSENYLVAYVGKDEVVTLPSNDYNYSIYQFAFFKNEIFSEVTISNKVTSIGELAL